MTAPKKRSHDQETALLVIKTKAISWEIRAVDIDLGRNYQLKDYHGRAVIVGDVYDENRKKFVNASCHLKDNVNGSICFDRQILVEKNIESGKRKRIFTNSYRVWWDFAKVVDFERNNVSGVSLLAPMILRATL